MTNNTIKILSLSATHDLHLYEDSAWKESALSKLEIILDDHRNHDAANFSDIGQDMQYGKNYRITISIEEI